MQIEVIILHKNIIPRIIIAIHGNLDMKRLRVTFITFTEINCCIKKIKQKYYSISLNQ